MLAGSCSIALVFSARPLLLRSLADVGAFHDIMVAFLFDESFYVIKMRTAVVMVIVGGHAGRHMHNDFILLRVSLLPELVGQMLEQCGQTGAAAAAAGHGEVSYIVPVLLEMIGPVVKRVCAGKTTASFS